MGQRRKKGTGTLTQKKPGIWKYRFAGIAHHPTELGLSEYVRVVKTFRAVSLVQAERIAQALVAAKLKATLHPKEDPTTTWQFFKDNEAAVLRGKGEGRYRVQITQGIKRFCDWMSTHHPKTPILQVTRKQAIAYIRWAMVKYTWRKATVKRNCTYLSQLWEVLIDEDRIEDAGNFWRSLPRRLYRRADLATTKENERRPKHILTWAEVDDILATLPDERRFLVDFLRRVPLRRGAFVLATLSHLRHDDDRNVWLLDVPVSKNKKGRSIPLPAELHKGLLTWRKRFCDRSVGDKAPLFGSWADERGWQTLYRAWQTAQTDAGVAHPMNMHNLRDLFAVAKRDAGVSWPVVSYLMGNDPRTAQAHYGYHVVADDAASAMGC